MKYLLCISLLIATQLINAQGVTPAPEDKAVVYFVRTSIISGILNFTFFDGDQIIARINSPNYIKYVCDPGEHLFWVKAENRNYLRLHLQPGKIYIIEAQPIPGFFKSGAKLVLITSERQNIKKYQKLFSQKLPTVNHPVEMNRMERSKRLIAIKGMLKAERIKYKIPLMVGRAFHHDELMYDKNKKRNARKTK